MGFFDQFAVCHLDFSAVFLETISGASSASLIRDTFSRLMQNSSIADLPDAAIMKLSRVPAILTSHPAIRKKKFPSSNSAFCLLSV